MAHFYGTIDGKAKTVASRTGTKRAGLRVAAASWEGAVDVQLSERDGVDWATVALVKWHGHGTDRVIYDGPVSGAPMIPCQCRARLQSDRDGDSNPFRCGHDDGHEGAHLCECGCGMTWGAGGPEGGWQAYDLREGLLVHRRGEPGWVRELQRSKKNAAHWDLVVHPTAGDYSQNGAKQYGARNEPDDYVFKCYTPVPANV